MSLITVTYSKELNVVKTPIDVRAEEIESVWNDLAEGSRLSIMEAGIAAKELAEFPERRRWLKIGAGFAAVRAEAKRLANTDNLKHPMYRRWFAQIIAKVPDLVALEQHDHASCQHAVWLYNNWEEVESFLAPLGIEANSKLNHPTHIKRRFDDAHKVKPQNLNKPPTPSARKNMRIAELEQQVRELEVRDLDSIVDGGEDQVREKVVNQVVTTDIFNRLHNAENQWNRFYNSRDGSKEEDAAWKSAKEDTEALTILLQDRYPNATSHLAELVAVREYQEDNQGVIAEAEDIVRSRTEGDDDGFDEDDCDFAKFKEYSVVLGCLLLLSDYYSVEEGEEPEVKLETYAAQISDLIQDHLMLTTNGSFPRTLTRIMAVLNQQSTESLDP